VPVAARGFNVPGMVLLADSWVGLLVPIPMYVLLRLLVLDEEAWLERTFGEEYHAYRARVPAVLPVPPTFQRAAWRRRRSRATRSAGGPTRGDP
jgi:hypothetical protein